MAEFTYYFESVHRITAGAIGEPGARVFYVQARRGNRLLSLKAEKEQVRALAEAIDHLLDELAEKNPRLSTSDDMIVMDMDLEEPLETEFRISQMGLGYDSERDMIVLVVQGLSDADEALQDEDDSILARFSATRPQMRALSVHASHIVAAGRPICGNCGRPIEPSGHFCPERNGHGPVQAH